MLAKGSEVAVRTMDIHWATPALTTFRWAQKLADGAVRDAFATGTRSDRAVALTTPTWGAIAFG